MGQLSSKIDATLFLRVGNTKDVYDLYHANQMRFSCPANWLDYAIKKGDQSTGDYQECVYAHLKKDDPRVCSQTDVKGNPMGENLLITCSKNSNDCWLRYMPTILMPTACFFSFNMDKMRNEQQKDGICKEVFFDLDLYLNAMGYEKTEASYLFIIRPIEFKNELIASVPKALQENESKLTTHRFYTNSDAEYTVFYDNVDYTHHKKDDFFFDKRDNYAEMFWKTPEYSYQNEVRFIIPNINFKQEFTYPGPYSSEENSLLVELPQLKDYSVVFPASKVHSIIFDCFDDSDRSMRVRII